MQVDMNAPIIIIPEEYATVPVNEFTCSSRYLSASLPISASTSSSTPVIFLSRVISSRRMLFEKYISREISSIALKITSVSSR
jgi:hypothetical protein